MPDRDHGLHGQRRARLQRRHGTVRIVVGKSGKANPIFRAGPMRRSSPSRPVCNVVVAHKGVVRWRCHTHGRAAHSSQPQLGENADLPHGAACCGAWSTISAKSSARLAEHPLCGRPTLSVGTIRGGLSVNTVPDRCTIEIDRRLIPGEEPQAAWQHVVDFVAGETALGSCIEHEPPFMQGRGLARRRQRRRWPSDWSPPCSSDGQRPPRTIGVPFGTDAAVVRRGRRAVVVFGPGSIDQAHTADEWLPLEEVEQASEALYQRCWRTGNMNEEPAKPQAASRLLRLLSRGSRSYGAFRTCPE